MEPIIPRDDAKPSRHKSAAFVHAGPDTLIAPVFHHVTCLGAGLVAAFAVLATGYFIYGFAETDFGPSLPASILICVLVGGLAFVPFGFIAKWALAAARGDWKTSRFWTAIFMLVPWVIVCALALAHSDVPQNWAAVGLGICVGLLSWPLRNLLALRRRRNQ